jgi:5'-phosphate synthase pdxT subunit
MLTPPDRVCAHPGFFPRHPAAWRKAGADVREVRTRADFEGLDALSMPGGESTTMLRLLGVLGLRKELEHAVRTLPVFATCAGAILLGEGGEHLPAPPLGVLDATVSRNAYGRQVDSFESDLDCAPLGGEVRGVFIRAPRFTRLGKDVEVIATHDGEAVGVRQGALVALAFHPELTDDPRLFEWFLTKVVPAGVRAEAAR